MMPRYQHVAAMVAGPGGLPSPCYARAIQDSVETAAPFRVNALRGALETPARAGLEDGMNDWRSIRADSIDWEANPISRRAGGYCRMMSNAIYLNSYSDSWSCGGWSDLTLGDIADLGVRHWGRCRNIGPLGVQVIKWIIDEAAEGRCPMLATKGRAADAYVPRATRPTTPGTGEGE